MFERFWRQPRRKFVKSRGRRGKRLLRLRYIADAMRLPIDVDLAEDIRRQFRGRVPRPVFSDWRKEIGLWLAVGASQQFFEAYFGMPLDRHNNFHRIVCSWGGCAWLPGRQGRPGYRHLVSRSHSSCA